MYSHSLQRTVRSEGKIKGNWLQQLPEPLVTYTYWMKSRKKSVAYERKMRVGSGIEEWDISTLEI